MSDNGIAEQKKAQCNKTKSTEVKAALMCVYAIVRWMCRGGGNSKGGPTQID